MFITAFVLLLAFQQKANCITDAADRGVRDIGLLNVLRNDLWRNNDDYIYKYNNSKLLPVFNKRSGADNVAKTNVKQQRADNIYNTFTYKDGNYVNGKMDLSNEIKRTLGPATPDAPAPVDPTGDATSLGKVKDPKAQEHRPLTNHRQASRGNPHNAEKFKLFLEKNKGLFQEFIKQKLRDVEPLSPAPAPPEQHRDSGRGTPGPAQLDMAPAKGGHLHSMRLKGRLCDRSVLMPEGPKYDSRGEVYLPAYVPGQRDYPATRAPRVVLPRCCNCCKKSVLGCE